MRQARIRHGRYLQRLKGWTGYEKNELLDGKYRPVFISYNKYGGERKYALPISYFEKKHLHKDDSSYAYVKATPENIKKMALFNMKYSDAKGSKRLAERELSKIRR